MQVGLCIYTGTRQRKNSHKEGQKVPKTFVSFVPFCGFFPCLQILNLNRLDLV